MMVLGSHGRGRVGTQLLGATSYAIAGYARCPVVIVRDGTSELPSPDRPVVVGVNAAATNDAPVIDDAVDRKDVWCAIVVRANGPYLPTSRPVGDAGWPRPAARLANMDPLSSTSFNPHRNPVRSLLSKVQDLSALDPTDLDGLLGRIVEVAADMTGARYGAMGVLDEDDPTQLAHFVTHGLSDQERREIGDPPRGTGVLGRMLKDPRGFAWLT